MDERENEREKLLQELNQLRQRVEELEKSRTEWTRTDDSMQEEERISASLFASTQDGISILDHELHIIRVNPAMKRLYADAQPLTGKKCHEVFHGQGIPCSACPALQTLKTGKTAGGLEIRKGMGGEGIGWLDLQTFPLVGVEDGKIRGVIAYIRDITERRRAEEALRQSEQEAKRLAKESGVLAEIGRIMASTLNIEQVYDHFAREVRKLIEFDNMSVVMLDLKAGSVNISYVSGTPIAGREFGSVVFLAGTAAERIYRTRSSLFLQGENLREMVGAIPGLRAALEAGMQSMMIVPLVCEGQVIGILNILSSRPDAYTGADLEMAEKVTTLIAGAAANAQLFRERQGVEEALRESERRYRLIAENLRDVIWTTDMNLRINYISPSVTRVRGFTVEEAMAQSPAEIYTPESLRKAQIAFAEELALEMKEEKDLFRSRTMDLELRCKDGSTFWSQTKASFLRDASGRAIGMLGVGRDISERRRAEASLRESEEKYRLVVENALEAIIVAQDGRLTFVNPKAMEVTGYTEKELTSRPFTDFLHPDDRAMVIENHLQRFRGAVPPVYAFRVVSRDGGIKWVEARAVVIDWAGKPATLNFLWDITERKRAEEERGKLEARIQRMEKMEALGTLAGGVAHDLNNILSALVGYPDLILMQLPQDSPHREALLVIQKSGQRAAAVVQDLLTLARRGVVSTEVLDLNDLLSDYLKTPEQEKIQWFHPHVRFGLDLEPGLLPIRGSRVHLSKTVMNLLSNAAEAMPEGGVVTISTANQYLDRPVKGYDDVTEGDYVVLAISDTGRGISAEDRRRIFEPFYTKKVMGRSGTGLGLAVVWGTVKDHNGYVDVHSEEGRGTTFFLYLPVTRETLTWSQPPVFPANYWGKGETVLVVDDGKEQRDLAEAMLSRLNYKVKTLPSGEEAIEYLKNGQADLLVLDMIMDPGIDGLETYRRISKFRPGQKAILLSGFSETERVREAQQLGAGAYVRKPYKLEKIGLAVRRELDKR